jgi:hypothetical protein
VGGISPRGGRSRARTKQNRRSTLGSAPVSPNPPRWWVAWLLVGVAAWLVLAWLLVALARSGGLVA